MGRVATPGAGRGQSGRQWAVALATDSAVFIRYDPDSKVYYVVDEIKMHESGPADVAQAIKCRNRFMQTVSHW